MDTWILTATAGYCHDDECHEHPIPSETSPCRDPEITTRQLAPNRPCAQSWRQISTSIQCLARCDQRTQPANVPEWQHYNVTHEVQVMDPFVARERRYRSSPNRLLYSLSARTGVTATCFLFQKWYEKSNHFFFKVWIINALANSMRVRPSISDVWPLQINGLVQDCDNSIVTTLESPQTCTKP